MKHTTEELKDLIQTFDIKMKIRIEDIKYALVEMNKIINKIKKFGDSL